jgi:hypothetical protein
MDHATQQLRYYVVSDINDEIRAAVAESIRALATAEHWMIGPPEFFDTIGDAGTRPEDQPVEFLGGALVLYSASTESLPTEIDTKALTEVETFVKAAQEVSRRKQLNIEFELDREFVGAIENGKIDRSLNEGLIGEWRRQLVGGH